MTNKLFNIFELIKIIKNTTSIKIAPKLVFIHAKSIHLYRNRFSSLKFMVICSITYLR